MPTIVLAELFSGFETGSCRKQNQVEFNGLISSQRVKVADITYVAARRYAKIYAYLRQKSRPIPPNGLWIAASSMEHSAALVSSDHHFQPLPKILIHYFMFALFFSK